jgi:hypothetical protein
MLDINRSQIWRGLTDATLGLFEVLKDAIDPTRPPELEVRYTDRIPEPTDSASVGNRPSQSTS